MCLSVYAYVPCMYLVPMEVRREHHCQDTLELVSWPLWAIMWMLGIEPNPLAEQLMLLTPTPALPYLLRQGLFLDM